MARPQKTGLDYFPLDVNIDDKMELIEAEHGLPGFAIVVKLWQKIYANGYFIKWDDDSILLFSKKINSDLTLINSVINSCFKRNLFSKEMYDEYKILTSNGIQKRYFTTMISLKRKNIYAEEHILLINPEETDIISELTIINSEFSTQKKGKEIKENKKKVNDNNWRVNFEVFKSEIWTEFDKISRDENWIKEQEKFNPDVDILLSIEKAIKNFWETPAGWRNKKKAKTENPNWKQTFAKTLDKNKVYKPKVQNGFKPIQPGDSRYCPTDFSDDQKF